MLLHHAFARRRARGEDIVLGTILEPALGVIRRTLVRAAQVEPAHLDIVALRLVPDHDLFGALDTAALVAFAPHRGFGSTDRRRRFGIGYRAFKPFHVDVGLAASIRDPNPSAYATTGRTSGHVSRNIVAGHSLPWSVEPHRKHNEVIKRNLTNIGIIGNRKRRSRSHSLVLRVNVGRRNTTLGRVLSLSERIGRSRMWLAVRPLGGVLSVE